MNERYSPLNEHQIEKVLSYDGKVDKKNIFIKYIGNPEIDYIKPMENYRMDFNDLQCHIQRPIIFIGLPNLPGQKGLFEESPMYEKVLKSAIGLNASIRFFDPHIDAKLIGKSQKTDYFLPTCEKAEDQYDYLRKIGCNINKLQL